MKRLLWILMVSVAVVTLLATAALPAGKSAVNGVRWARREGGIRVVVDMASPAKYGVERTGGKIILTVPEGTLSMKTRGGKLSSPGKTWQIKTTGKGVRLVIDTGNSRTGLKHFTMTGPFRIILDLKPAPAQPKPKAVPPVTSPVPKAASPKPKVAEKTAAAVLPEDESPLWPLKRGKPVGDSRDSVEIPLLEKDLAVNSVFNTQISYFQVSPSWRVRDCAVELTLSHSQMTDVRFSNLTVEVNGLPVKTVPLNGDNLWKGRVKLQIPADYLEPGANFVTLRSFMRANDIPCRDIDNPGNWLRVHRDSRIVIHYGLKSRFSLADFPEPFFEPDGDRGASCIFVIPDGAGTPEVEAALNILTNWAANYPLRDLQPRLARVSELTKMELARSHLIFLGQRGSFDPAVLAPFDVAGVNWDGNVLISSFAGDEGRGRLLVTAGTPEGLHFGVRALLTPEVRKQMATERVVLPLSMPLGAPLPVGAGSTKVDLTLKDIFVDDIVFRGTAGHTAPLSFYIPPQWEVTGNPYLLLKFHHSPALRPDRSSLTVDFEEVPRKAVELGPDNVEEGRLVVPIPDGYNGGDFLSINLKGYLDIGSADCNHNYSEAAWLVVDRDSTFHIPHGNRPLLPYLESLPFAFGTGPLEVYLESGLDGPALSGLATLLSLWQTELAEPLRFSLRDLPKGAVAEVPEHHRLFFGDWKKLEEAGLSPDVSLSPDGKELVSGAKVPVVSEFALNGAFLQLMERGETLDLMVGWADRSPLPGVFRRIQGKLGGETALVSSAGDTIAFYPRRGVPGEPEEELKPAGTQWEKVLEFLHGERRAAALVGSASAVVLLGLFIVLVKLIRRGR